MIALLPQDVRDYLEGYNITASILSDEWIQNKIDMSIIPFVEEITRQSFSEIKEITEYYSGNGENILMLNRRPVVEVTNIQYVTATNVESTVSIANVELIGAQGILKSRVNLEYTYQQRRPLFSKGNRNIKITYTYGYTNAPSDVIEAIKMLTAEKCLAIIANRTGGGDLTVQSFGRSYGGHSKYTNIRKEMIREAMALLRKYMTSVVG